MANRGHVTNLVEKPLQLTPGRLMAEESVGEDPTSPGVLASPACKSGSSPEWQGPEMPETKYSNCVAGPCDERPGWWRCLGGFPPGVVASTRPCSPGAARQVGDPVEVLGLRGPGPAFAVVLVECPVRVDAIEPVPVSSWAGGPGCGGGRDGVMAGVAGVGGYPGSELPLLGCECRGSAYSSYRWRRGRPCNACRRAPVGCQRGPTIFISQCVNSPLARSFSSRIVLDGSRRCCYNQTPGVSVGMLHSGSSGRGAVTETLRRMGR